MYILCVYMRYLCGVPITLFDTCFTSKVLNVFDD